MLDYFLLLILSILIWFTTIYAFKKLYFKLNILDNPKKYNLKRDPIPYSMWVVFFVSFFLMSFFLTQLWYLEYNFKLGLIWVFWFFITAISFLDDRLEVSAKVRLFFQILIWAIIWITSIKIWYVSNVFWWIINLETYFIELYNIKIYIIPLIFTVIWYVFIFNALNWTDWIQWNTSWISIISFFILFLLWLILFYRDNYVEGIKNAQFIMTISIILVWIIIPFWYYDFNQKILMWDSWTMFLWFMLATLAIISWWKIATVLVVFWIYSVDAVYVLVRRLLNKKNPLSWDFSHLHHRLLDLWLERKNVLYLIYALSLFFGLTGLFLDKTWKIIVFCFIIIIVVFINKIVEAWIKWKEKILLKK
jgi:UDP-GlcNAc:undecaprenyl-phosphate GlcNAc-1-phosphate transferase